MFKYSTHTNKKRAKPSVFETEKKRTKTESATKSFSEIPKKTIDQLFGGKSENTAVTNATMLNPDMLSQINQGQSSHESSQLDQVRQRLAGMSGDENIDEQVAVKRQFEYQKSEERRAQEYMKQKERARKEKEMEEERQKVEEENKEREEKQQQVSEPGTKQKRGMLFKRRKKEQTIENRPAKGKH